MMKFIDEFRDRELCEILLEKIHQEATGEMTVMEVCGGHTSAIHRFGIPSLLPVTIHLLSGPGCPVCVTGRGYIDNAVLLSKTEGTTVCTYGDLMRVPGSAGTLEEARAGGGSVEIIHSPLQCVDMAISNPEGNYVFLGIGFETTAPACAVSILRAYEKGVTNYFVYGAHKLMPPAMAAVIQAGVGVDAYLCPGHVSTITGTAMYEPLVAEFGVGCVISGFEPADILQSLLMLIRQSNSGSKVVEIQYTRAVKHEGNIRAQRLMDDVFEPGDSWWRGLGLLPGSGLRIREKYQGHDASAVFSLSDNEPADPPGCMCGEVLKGLARPDMCVLFGSMCTPDDPVGACMVSAEGVCQTWYNYAKQ